MTMRNCLVAAFAAAGLSVAADRVSAQVSVTPGGVNVTGGGTGAVVPFNGGPTFTAPGLGSYTVPNGAVMPTGGMMGNSYYTPGFTQSGYATPWTMTNGAIQSGYVTPGTTTNGMAQTGYATPMSTMTPYNTSSMYYPMTGYSYPMYTTGSTYGTTMMTSGTSGRVRRGLFRR